MGYYYYYYYYLSYLSLTMNYDYATIGNVSYVIVSATF